MGRVDSSVARIVQSGRLYQSQLGTSMTPEQRLLNETRRHFFSRCAIGVGQIALTQLLSGGRLLAAPAASSSPMEPKPPHFPAKVKNVIYLFMAGGPSQLEMFDYKPKLQEFDGKPIPD